MSFSKNDLLGQLSLDQACVSKNPLEFESLKITTRINYCQANLLFGQVVSNPKNRLLFAMKILLKIK